MTARKYLISVLPETLDEGSLEYKDSVLWSYGNVDHENVLDISLEDIYKLAPVWDIINDQNDSMIGPHEDSWIATQENRILILERLKAYSKKDINSEERKILNRILELLRKAIQINHNIYFLF